MTQNAPYWITLVAAAIVFGAAFVAILVARRSLESVFVAASIIAFAFAGWAFGELSVAYDRFDVLLWALGFGAAAFCGGYALASTLLASLATKTRRLVRPTTLPDDPGASAVVLVGAIDPDVYDERWTAVELDRLSEEGLLHVSVAILPFLFFAQKARYRAVGGSSPAARQLNWLADRLAEALAAHGVGRVESAWLGGRRDLATAVLKLVERGFRSIQVVEVMVAGSLELDEAKRRVDALRLDELGVSVNYADPLWGSERVAALVADRVMTVVSDPGATGVVLVGIGQPEERAGSCRSFDEQETAFLNRIRMLLVERGLSDSNVQLSWADWHGPDVTGAVRHVAALGCERLVVMPACFPLDTVETMLELPLAVRQARIDESTSVVSLSAWHDDSGLLETLAEKAAGVPSKDDAAGR
ncbi:MAG: hypothetical protein HGB10_07045 [Coriobacteriia bacterium]|nr:hypothetical protein [Coriobacteriia bacterium]